MYKVCCADDALQDVGLVSQKFHCEMQVRVVLVPSMCDVLCCAVLQVQTSLTDAALLTPGRSPGGISNRLVVAAQAAWARRQQGRRLTAFQKDVGC